VLCVALAVANADAGEQGSASEHAEPEPSAAA
jgi:hypothetical protein